MRVRGCDLRVDDYKGVPSEDSCWGGGVQRCTHRRSGLPRRKAYKPSPAAPQHGEGVQHALQSARLRGIDVCRTNQVEGPGSLRFWGLEQREVAQGKMYAKEILLLRYES